MLEHKVQLRFIKNLYLPFQYTLLSRAKRLYYKDYAVDIPHIITKEQSVPTEYMRGSTVLLKHNRKFYWSPQFEEMYRACKTEGARQTMNRTCKIKDLKDKIELSFKSQVRNYTTNEVKLIIIQDE